MIVTAPRTFLDGRVVLHAGDCREILKTIPDNSIDSCVCDPPYHLQSISKRFSKVGRTDKTWSRSGPHQRTAGGFMNKQWDGGDIAFQPELWAEVLRVLKPGGYIMAFSGCRTYHRMACAIEDAGFITHPFFAWAFGSGFAKAHNLSKQLDKMAGKPRDVVGRRQFANGTFARATAGSSGVPASGAAGQAYITVPATDAAREWDGWFYGTQSLKPAIEPVYFGQKPFERGINGAQNVQKWGTGAINVGACRVPTDDGTSRTQNGNHNPSSYSVIGDPRITGGADGRWPANLIHDNSEEVLACFPETNGAHGNLSGNEPVANKIYGKFDHRIAQDARNDSGSAARFFASFPQDDERPKGYRKSGFRIGGKSETAVGLNGVKYAPDNYGDSGTPARFFASFPQDEDSCRPLHLGQSTTGERESCPAPNRIFYTAKAGADDRLGSKHPTVKPLDLIQYLVRLITPPGGTVFDPFAGTATTAEAAFREGFKAIICEREAEYIADIERRMALVMEGPMTRAYAGMKARGRPRDDGPLFGGGDDICVDRASIPQMGSLDRDRHMRKHVAGGTTLENVASLFPDEAAE